MAAIKTDGNQETGLDYTEVIRRLEHIEDLAHRNEQNTAQILAFIEHHKPALDRGMALLDPGAKLRSALGRKSRG